MHGASGRNDAAFAEFGGRAPESAADAVLVVGPQFVPRFTLPLVGPLWGGRERSERGFARQSAGQTPPRPPSRRCAPLRRSTIPTRGRVTRGAISPSDT